jgi:hypothetical protein
MSKVTTRFAKLQRIGDKLVAERRESLQAVGEQLAALLETDAAPAGVIDGIQAHLSELASVVPLWNPRIIRAAYWIMAEEAEREGVDLGEYDLIGQHIRAHPETYKSTEAVN